MQKLDWKQIKKNLKELNLPYQQHTNRPELDNLARAYGYVPHSMTVSLNNMENVKGGEGVVVTHENPESNNGVYLFCLHLDSAVNLVVLIPSTISKSPMIHKVVGDITTAIEGITTPALTTFDKVEIAGFIIVDTIIKPLRIALGIPKEKEQQFINIYLAKFMANVTRQYLGSPDLLEETVDAEPQWVKQMILNPELFTKENKNESEGDSNAEKKDSNVEADDSKQD